MTLDDLVGTRLLSGVDFNEEVTKDDFQKVQAIRFCLDGIAYIALEDPSDSYRSRMDEIRVSDTPCKDSFNPVPVVARKMGDGEYGKTNDVLELVNPLSNEVILSVGTKNTDYYYPSWVSQFDRSKL